MRPKMTESIDNVAQCSCTRDSDCERCKKLENIGYRFIEANGEKGVALFVREHEQLRETIRKDREAMKKAKEVIKVIYRDSFNRASLNLEHENLLLETELLLGARLEVKDE